MKPIAARLAAGPALLALLAFALAAPAGVLAGQEKTIDGVLHVQNDAPAAGTQTWKLEELWRVGGEEDEVLFGVIGAVQVDPQGNLYLLDSQMSEVKVYSPDGKLLRTLSREGEGPGETRNPNGMRLLPDGKLAITQAFPGKVTIIDTQGQPAGGFTIGGKDPTQGGFAILHGIGAGGGNFVCGVEMAEQGESQTSQKRRSGVASFGPDGARKTTYCEKSWTLEFDNLVVDDSAHMDFAARRYTVGPDGSVYVAPDRDSYAVHVYRPDGKLARVVERAVTPRKRTEAEVKLLHDLFQMATRQIPIPVKIEIGATEPPINWFMNGVQVRPDGTLWVLSDAGGREQPAGVMLTYDVFDPKGHFAHRVSMACPGDPDQDVLFFAGAERMILVTGFLDAIRAMIGGGAAAEDAEEPAPMEVVCYKVASRG